MEMKNKAYQDSAKGKNCTVNIPGICSHDPRETTLAHLRCDGMIMKCPDFIAVYACYPCHNFIDKRDDEALEMDPSRLAMFKYHALMATLQSAFEEGHIQWRR